MTEYEEKQLKLEIAHIFESGANEIRVFNMFRDFLGLHDFELNKLPITAVGSRRKLLMRFVEFGCTPEYWEQCKDLETKQVDIYLEAH